MKHETEIERENRRARFERAKHHAKMVVKGEPVDLRDDDE